MRLVRDGQRGLIKHYYLFYKSGCVLQTVFPVSILSPTPTSHSPTIWPPAGSFSSHHSTGQGLDLSSAPPPPPRPRPASAATLTTRGQQGSVREPGTYSVRSTAAEGRGARAQEGRNGSDALNCPVCFPLLPGILGTGSKKRRQMGSVEGWELGKRKKNAE